MDENSKLVKTDPKRANNYHFRGKFLNKSHNIIFYQNVQKKSQTIFNNFLYFTNWGWVSGFGQEDVVLLLD